MFLAYLLLSVMYSFHSQGSPFTSQLQKDRDALLQQVQALERKLEVSRSENESLKTSISEVQRKVGPVENHHIVLYFLPKLHLYVCMYVCM